MFIFFLLKSVYAGCPKIECNSEPIGVCGSTGNDTININEQGCTSTTFCELETLYD